MNKVSRVKNDNFTIISNVFLKDKNLSIKAKGFLAVVMGLPSDWEFSIDGICSILKEGKTSIYNVIDELKEYGYCSVMTTRDEKGRICGNDYKFYEEPQIESPRMENPNMDNQPQLNTYSIKDLFDKEEKEDKSSKKKANAMPSNEEHQMFEEFRKAYQGKKRGHDTEFNFFIAQNKDWREVLPKLSLAVTKENVLREQARSLNKFFPEPKNLQTYLNGKNRAWEVFVDDSNNGLFTIDNDNGKTTKKDTLIINGVCYK